MTSKASKFQMSRKTKILLGIVFSVLAIVLIVFSFYFAGHEMFDWNNRFILRRIQVESPEGWWNGKSEAVIRVLNRQEKKLSGTKLSLKGDTNLFAVNPAAIRKILSKEPGIRSVSVIRNLPDTLIIRIVERFPCAVIGSWKSSVLIDSEGILIPRTRFTRSVHGLPLIVNAVPSPAFGKKFTAIMPAIDLIRLSQTAYPAIRFNYIYAGDPSYMKVRFRFNNDPRDVYIVEMLPQNPVQNMNRIMTTLRDLKRRGGANGSRIIDLRFKNQSVIKAK